MPKRSAVLFDRGVWNHTDDDIQIARRSAWRGGEFALVFQFEPESRIDTGWDFNLELAILADSTRASAALAGIGDNLSRTLAGGASTAYREKSLLLADLP